MIRYVQRAVAMLLVLAASASCSGSGLVSRPRDGGGGNDGPFVQTAAVLYGGFGSSRPGRCFPLEEGAKFDLIDTDLGNAHRWCGRPSEPFLALKQLNPQTTILLYLMGPTSFKTSSRFGFVGEDWEWVRTNHGRDAQDRWTGLGVQTGDYLLHVGYPVERVMILGNPNWQQTWVNWSLQHLDATSPSGVRARGADGIFADGMTYTFNGVNSWCPESRWNGSSCAGIDYHSTYFSAGSTQPNNQLWQQHYREFMERMQGAYRTAGKAFGLNAWIIRPEASWVYAAAGAALGGRLYVMQERGFVWFTGYDRVHWQRTLQAILDARSYKVIVVNGVDGDSSRSMDAVYWGNTGWEWLWFSLMSYLLGYDPTLRNAYFHFVVFDRLTYDEGLWVDEYDPRPLHLGKPAGPAQQAASGVWLRAFERGWVVVNPGDVSVEVQVPSGQARVLDHSNFKNPGAVEPVSRFVLPPRRGVALLK